LSWGDVIRKMIKLNERGDNLEGCRSSLLPCLTNPEFLTFFTHTAADIYGEIDTEI
jgi:hypothetical protein